jgi:DNA-binding ferritin-like protein
MRMDRSVSLEENEVAYVEVCGLVERYNLRFGTLALSMFQMKKFAEDMNLKSGVKRCSTRLELTRAETEQFEQLKRKIVEEMKAARELGGEERKYFYEQLSRQVEFVNFEIYGEQQRSPDSK